MNSVRHAIGGLIALLVSVGLCAQTNATVTFSGKGALALTQETLVVLTVAKKKIPGPGTNEIDKTEGAHKFPNGTTLAAIAGYYKTILIQNGFVEGSDFQICDSSIHFYGVDKVDGGNSGKVVSVEASLDKGKFDPIPVQLSMERGSKPLHGVVTITAAAFVASTSPSVRTSHVSVHYRPEDSAAGIMERISAALNADGWSASADGNAVVITSHRGGAPTHSFSIRFQHLPRAGEGAPSVDGAEDHWAMERVLN